MKSVRLALVLGFVVGALAYLVFSPPERRNRQVSVGARDLEIGEPIVFRGLTVFPVVSRTPRNDDRFITLDEGLAAGTVEIVEVGATDINPAPIDPAQLASDPFAAPRPSESVVQAPAPATDPFADAPAPANPPQPAEVAASGEQLIVNTPAPIRVNSVNQLMVVNRSEKPLYLMPGEIVVGGSQDRVVGQELVVAPNKQAAPLDVYCVEHGRWGGRAAAAYAEILASSASFSAAGEGEAASSSEPGRINLNAVQAADIANAGKFACSVGSLNAQARLTVQKDKNQQKVWDEVAKQNTKSDVDSLTGTFTSNYSDTESIERLTPFIDKLRGPIDETKNVVGVIVAVNGEVKSMDVFKSTPLFRKLWPKLLKSYALDAANAAGDEQATKSATRSQAESFFNEVAKARSAQVEDRGTVAVTQRESERALLFSAHEREPTAAAGPVGMGGAFGGVGLGGMSADFDDAIHASGFSK